MNNGLDGRYLEQLEAWNKARQFAAELVEGFYENDISGVLSRWNVTVSFPSKDEIKSILNSIVFLNGRDTIDTVARNVIDWDGWYENPTPSMQSTTKVKV